MDIKSTAEALLKFPSLYKLGFHMIPRFFRLAQLARPYVESQMQDKRAPPTTLPPKIVKVFMGAMDQEDSSAIEALWSTFRYSIWGVLSAIEAKEEDITIYNKFSLTLGTSYRHLYPPVRSCQDAFCVNR
ncbi:uncharacterized protein LACBIDRAFT_309764 [Laccaria bicolor S238N-H82]|uniref:Predicted protein n=1 Tax=Laccaria bicolor (strain S238N-H82 / ATCC MYA-4686) TaxID=486041 RepID=B0DT14_LACBS|nr:uncharacterized protein LACBIDRAFT_309764 [Laccaria bicolor S238N-H82]EDR02333.1 predicted protein [Laccaria bicolor S238N-H82]|eukprot:XP_001887010.1 predicted protein [Laccaria bicolor S238N-H82]